MDVGGWLRSLGLGQYEALFRASEIDAYILPELTEVDLEKLGVPLGHRKRLLRAISGLTAAGTLAAPSASTVSKPHDAAERRQPPPRTHPGFARGRDLGAPLRIDRFEAARRRRAAAADGDVLRSRGLD